MQSTDSMRRADSYQGSGNASKYRPISMNFEELLQRVVGDNPRTLTEAVVTLELKPGSIECAAFEATMVFAAHAPVIKVDIQVRV